MLYFLFYDYLLLLVIYHSSARSLSFSSYELGRSDVCGARGGVGGLRCRCSRILNPNKTLTQTDTLNRNPLKDQTPVPKPLCLSGLSGTKP